MTQSRPQSIRGVPVATACRMVLVAGVACVLAAAAGCGGRDPFRHARVSGDVRYRDGTLIDCEGLRLSFTPLGPPRDPRTHPRPGTATVDTRTGQFASATTRRTGDGLVRGRHKVALRTTDGGPLPIDVVGQEYAAAATTPVEIDTDVLPLRIRIPRPTVVAVRGAVVRGDGSPLLAPDAVCGFFIPDGAARSRGFREIGSAAIDAQTGEFATVSRGGENGLFAGSYRVTIRAADGEPLPATVVPERYADPRTTPLTIDTAAAPLTLAIP